MDYSTRVKKYSLNIQGKCVLLDETCIAVKVGLHGYPIWHQYLCWLFLTQCWFTDKLNTTYLSYLGSSLWFIWYFCELSVKKSCFMIRFQNDYNSIGFLYSWQLHLDHTFMLALSYLIWICLQSWIRITRLQKNQEKNHVKVSKSRL